MVDDLSSARGRLLNVSMAINRPILAFVHIEHMFILPFLFVIYSCMYVFFFFFFF